MSRILRSALLLASTALLAACAAGEAEGERASGSRRTPLVEAVPARFGQLPQEERVSGVVRAENQVTLRPEVSAAVVEVLVRNGDAVQKGQPLVRLDDSKLRDQFRHSEAALRLAEAEAAEARFRVQELEAQASRSEALAAQNLTSELEHEIQVSRLEAERAVAEQAAARVDQANATRDERRADLAKTLVRAPIAGRVGRQDVEIGMLADPGTALFVLGNLDRVTVEVPLTEGMLGLVREGMSVRVSSEALGDEPISGKLARISPFLTEGSFSTRGEADLANPDGRLRPGMFVTVDVLYGETEEATLVPVSALWEVASDGRRGVFVLPEQRGGEMDPAQSESPAAEQPAEFRPVTVLAEGSGVAGVTGIEPGEWIVTVGQQLLRVDEAAPTRVRPTTWIRVLRLQGLQREDLLERYLAEQQEYARERGAVPPDNVEFAGRKSVDGASR